MSIHTILTETAGFWREALQIWSSGGWAMIAIAAIAFVMFAMGVHVHGRLRAKGFVQVPEKVWRHWIKAPEERTGPIGEILDYAMTARSLKEMGDHFGQVRRSELVPIERDLLVMKICVGAAPLVGLLGTVTGMLTTFSALAAGSGGDKTMNLVASGISEALITTETGLVIALPGLFFQYLLLRKHQGYKAFLAHMEVVCTQVLYRKIQRATRLAA